eukprot:7882105-Heterocapsa_arctica.AAC.1
MLMMGSASLTSSIDFEADRRFLIDLVFRSIALGSSCPIEPASDGPAQKTGVDMALGEANPAGSVDAAGTE